MRSSLEELERDLDLDELLLFVPELNDCLLVCVGNWECAEEFSPFASDEISEWSFWLPVSVSKLTDLSEFIIVSAIAENFFVLDLKLWLDVDMMWYRIGLIALYEIEWVRDKQEVKTREKLEKHECHNT